MPHIPRIRIAAAAVVLLVLAVAIVVIGGNRRAEAALIRLDPEHVRDDPALSSTAMRIGEEVYSAHCARCHGTQGHADPARGIPDLTDQDFLYGAGQVGEIEQIVLHGIRSGDPKGWHLASMPAYGTPKPYANEPIPSLSPAEIDDLVQFLLARHGRETDAASAGRGAALYRNKAGCYDCHSVDIGGDPAIGAPNLADDVWLYGDGSARSLWHTLAWGRAGASPAYAKVLTPVEARAVAVYVAALSRPTAKATR